MKNKHLFTFCLLSAPVFSAGVYCQKTEKKPNIVLILADDMGYSDLGCYGSEIQTPNLDRLASQGIRFTQFYNTARCGPSRATLLTGLYQLEDQLRMANITAKQGQQVFLNNNCVTLGEALKYNGYNTYMSGKWHLANRPENLPKKRGFDRYFGTLDGAGSYFQRIPFTNIGPAPKWMLDESDYNPPDSGFYMTNAITDYALTFLKEESGKKEPFFLYLAYTAPHWPLHALPEDIAKYRGKYMKGWDLLRHERYQRMLQLGVIDSSTKLSPRDEEAPDWESLSIEDKKMWDLRMSVYAAMIDCMDQNIGRVLEQLTRMGEIDNTLIIFLSDNGGCHERVKNQGRYIRTTGETGNPDSFDAYEGPWANVSNTPFRLFKSWVHEGGISTPFIAFLPEKIKGGSITSQPAHLIDIMPTLIELSAGKYPENYKGNTIQPMEGISLVPAFKGKSLNRDNPLFWEHMQNRAMRSGDWKLVMDYVNSSKKNKTWELYNLRNDRSELIDLSSKHPERTKQMIEQYYKWADRIGLALKEVPDNKK